MQTTSENLMSILVTGANKGIGYGIVKSLLERAHLSNIYRYKIILTSRDEQRGLETIEKLKVLFGNSDYTQKNLIFHKLDITSKESVDNCVTWLKADIGPLDVLVNNAGVAFKGPEFNTNVFDITFGTNVFGTIDFTEKILENNLIKRLGKIIIVASSLGNIITLSAERQKDFRIEKMQVSELVDLANKYRKSIETGSNEKEGWGKNCYAVSKMVINKYTQLLSQRESVLSNAIQVYSCCPGWVKTDMGGPKAFRELDEGVVCPVYLVELEHKLNMELQGKFFYDFKVKDIGL
jgi:NAD(P)-dependent dehydrogenase (short-subunit alcohol dehydrogenase family)